MLKVTKFRVNHWGHRIIYLIFYLGSFVPTTPLSIKRVKPAQTGTMWTARPRLSITPAITSTYIESVLVWNPWATTTCVATPSPRIIFSAAKPATRFDRPRTRWIEYLRPTTTIARYCEVAVAAISTTETTRKTNTRTRNRIKRIKIPRGRAASERSVGSNSTTVMVTATIRQLPPPRRHQPYPTKTPTTAIITTTIIIINDPRHTFRQRPSDLKRITTRIRTRKDTTYRRPRIDLARRIRIRILTTSHPARLLKQLRTSTQTSTMSITQTTINKIPAVPFKPQRWNRAATIQRPAIRLINSRNPPPFSRVLITRQVTIPIINRGATTISNEEAAHQQLHISPPHPRLSFTIITTTTTTTTASTDQLHPLVRTFPKPPPNITPTISQAIAMHPPLIVRQRKNMWTQTTLSRRAPWGATTTANITTRRAKRASLPLSTTIARKRRRRQLSTIITTTRAAASRTISKQARVASTSRDLPPWESVSVPRVSIISPSHRGPPRQYQGKFLTSLW